MCIREKLECEATCPDRAEGSFKLSLQRVSFCLLLSLLGDTNLVVLLYSQEASLHPSSCFLSHYRSSLFK